MSHDRQKRDTMSLEKLTCEGIKYKIVAKQK